MLSYSPITANFFNRDACVVAKDLLGKVIRRYYQGHWLAAQVIETEAYYIHDKGSHALLGRTPSREALFMSAGTLYLYYARGKPSLNISCQGEGNAVLIKSAFPYTDKRSPAESLLMMQQLNPHPNTGSMRAIDKLCAGQTHVCSALALTVADWNKKPCSGPLFYFEDVGYQPKKMIQTTRLGIPLGRDEHLMYRYIDKAHVRHCTRNPLTSQKFQWVFA